MKKNNRLEPTQNGETRRDFLKKAGIMGGITCIGGNATAAVWETTRQQANGNGDLITISPCPKRHVFSPLQEIELATKQAGEISLRDAQGKEYFREKVKTSAKAEIAGALGKQTIFLQDKKGRILDFAVMEVNAKTQIKDEKNEYGKLLEILYSTMLGEWGRAASILHIEGKFYHTFVSWLRDHVHTLKGMKYFYHELKSGIDLYADTQRHDGMIYDNIKPRNPEPNMWEQRFNYGNFLKKLENAYWEMKRIPVENDVEYLFLEGIYYTWKATADDEWMKSMLPYALKAVDYATSNPYRWSKKYKLLKRGYTIDTWDFQSSYDAAITNDPMVIYKDKTYFGIMYGDNTGMAAGCKYLAEMLDYTGQKEKAKRIETLGNDLKRRIDELAWNGDFYTHHVPIKDNPNRNFGVDTSKQVSLSNAYSINRTLTHQQVQSIIKTYQRLKEEMPDSSQGEWYTIYPPFEKGFGGHNSKWEYMNGGVTSIVAGELAHGAFEHGFEKYGVDILNRIKQLSAKTQNYLHCSYRGAMPNKPKRSFENVNLRHIANVDFYGNNNNKAVPGWTGESENDLHEMPVGKQKFEDIPFDVIDPAKNGRRACLGLGKGEGYKLSESININKKAASVYFLQTLAGSTPAGTITLHYSDGTYHSDIQKGNAIRNWWHPTSPGAGKSMPKAKIAWRGKNEIANNIGVMVYGLNNPHPKKTINKIEFEGVKSGSKWFVLGITLCDQPVFFMPDIISTGIPDNWGAAAVVYALVEGLAGVKDNSTAYKHALLAPRWSAAGINKVSATIKYEASGGYLSYNYAMNNDKNLLLMKFTGNGDNISLKILLPDNKKAISGQLNGKAVNIKNEKVENSTYAVLNMKNKGAHKLTLQLG